jgi:hypothetical protein
MMRTAGTGRTRILTASLVLLGLFAGMIQGQRNVTLIDQSPYLQVEVLEAGLGPCLSTDDSAKHVLAHQVGYLSARALKLTYHFPHGLRAGISFEDAGMVPDLQDMGYPSGGSFAPIHVGYDIAFNPKKTAFFYGMVPSCYVEATLGALPLYAKLAVACDIDYYGIGIGAEAGCLTWNNQPPWGPNPPPFRPALYAALKLRLLDATFRLPGRR